MYSYLFSPVFSDSYISSTRFVYVISDSQLEELKHKERQDELDNIDVARKRLEKTYQSRLKVLVEREHELQEEIKALAPVTKENANA